MDKLTIGGGCFWGMEELFRAQSGVTDTRVGYAGGNNDNPTYENHLGHAETLEVTFDPSVTSRGELLDYFFKIHDPTTKNRQGNDVGTSYRSVIFYENETEKRAAERSIIRNQTHWEKPIATSIEPLTQFWSAEEYHQDYLQKNPGGYTCHYERPW
jgi:peptide-methionine (S)-S-oxide reductase